MTDTAFSYGVHQAGKNPITVTAAVNPRRPGAPRGSSATSPGLGINTKFDSAPPSMGVNGGHPLSARVANRHRRWSEQIATGDSRLTRFAQLAYLRERLPGPEMIDGKGRLEFRTKNCLAHLRFGQEFLTLLYNPEQQKARLHGAAVCGSVWTCPICAERITAIRRTELKQMLGLNKMGYQVAMVTFTLEHHQGEDLGPMVDALNKAIRAVKTHRPWRKFVKKWGLVGGVHALEVTHGQNGWHPHRHEMFVFDPKINGLSGKEAKLKFETEMQQELYELYHYELNRAGRDCDEEHGVKVSANRKDYGDYIGKWGVTEELTRSVNKLASNGGKSVWELLTDAVNGDQRAWFLFLEYARAFKGKKQLHWSAGLRDLLSLPEKEPTDEEAAQTEPESGDVVITQFSRWDMAWLRDRDLYGPLVMETERVKGGVIEIMDFLARMGYRRSADRLI